jgi:hypothetical protein
VTKEQLREAYIKEYLDDIEETFTLSEYMALIFGYEMAKREASKSWVEKCADILKGK